MKSGTSSTVNLRIWGFSSTLTSYRDDMDDSDSTRGEGEVEKEGEGGKEKKDWRTNVRRKN